MATKKDFALTGENTGILTIIPQTKKAERYMKQLHVEPWQSIGGGVACEEAMLYDVVLRWKSEGVTFEPLFA